MDIKELDLTNERLVLEAMAIHCTCPQEWGGPIKPDAHGVAEQLAKLQRPIPKVIYYIQEHGRIIALYWLEVPVRRRGYIRSIWIDPAYRLMGLGRRLQRAGDDWFSNHKVRQVEAQIDEKNTVLRSLNERLGFVEKGDSFVKEFVLTTS